MEASVMESIQLLVITKVAYCNCMNPELTHQSFEKHQDRKRTFILSMASHFRSTQLSSAQLCYALLTFA